MIEFNFDLSQLESLSQVLKLTPETAVAKWTTL